MSKGNDVPTKLRVVYEGVIAKEGSDVIIKAEREVSSPAEAADVASELAEKHEQAGITHNFTLQISYGGNSWAIVPWPKAALDKLL